MLFRVFYPLVVLFEFTTKNGPKYEKYTLSRDSMELNNPMIGR